MRKSNDRVGFAAVIAALSALPVAASAQIVLPPGQTTYDVPSGTQNLTQQVTGTGGIDKTGAGSLQFSYTGSPATNYSGPTNITGGSVDANGINSLSPQSAFNISSGAALNLNGHDNTIAALSGAGTVNKGNGALTVGGDNSSTIFSGKITGTLVPFTTGGDQVQFTKAGTGTLTLTGTNDYRGTTRIAGGTLRAGSTTSLAGTMLIESGATLDMNGYSNFVGGIRGAGNISLGNATLTIFNADNSTAAPMTGAITGTGGLNIARAGGVILAGNATYSGPTVLGTSTSSLTAGAANAFSPNSALQLFVSTVSLNGFDQAVGSLSGEGSNIFLGSGRLTMGGDNTSTVYHGSISGTGGLTKVGTGQFTLNMPVAYTGTTIVNAGTFRLHPDGVLPGGATVNGGVFLVEGKVNGPVTVNGGVLKGTGSIASLTVNNATLAPGNSIGTLNVAGNLTFGANSVYQVEADASGAADRIAATGSAGLGGTVQVVAADGTYAPTTNYTILTATGGVTGTFAGVSDNLAFLDSSLSYGSNNVVLTLTRNDTDFSAVASNPNQNAAADAIESTGFGTPLYNALLGASAAAARSAFDILSGTIHASMLSAQLEDGQSLRSAMLTQLRSDPHDDSDIRVWGNVLANWSGADSTTSITGMDQDIVSVQGGVDMRIDDGWRLGVTLGYETSHLDLRDKASRARSTGWHTGLYGQGMAGPIALRGERSSIRAMRGSIATSHS